MGTTTIFFHGDHLGSVSLVTNSVGTELSRQSFDPWGKRRSGSVSQTNRNYTGQQLDDTGLLYYHARYYDPTLGRFLSPDTVVPGNASGGMDGVALKPLTVDFHETGFVSGLGSENGQPFWFQMSDHDRQQAGNPFGPADPQALDRYSYVRNNPLKWTDPTGHCAECIAAMLGAAGFTVSAPVIAAIAVVLSVSLLVVFLSDAQNRSWLSYQIAQGITNIDTFVDSLVGRATGQEPLPTVHQSSWNNRPTDVGTRQVRRLSDREVRDRGLHPSKKQRGMGATDSYYVDKDGNLYSGGNKGELTLEELDDDG